MLRKDIILIIESLLKKDMKRRLHVSCSNRRFYNGVIENCDDEDIMIFIDDKLGSYPIPYSLIVNVEPMREK